MKDITISDIYAGMPDAKDEIDTEQEDGFFASFIIPPGLPMNHLLNGRKFLVTGYKGVGKTSVLFYLQMKAKERDSATCTSFMYFKSDFEEVQKSRMETVAKSLTAIVDIRGEIQPNKVEYLHIWRWVIYKKIVDDCEQFEGGLFEDDDNWQNFVKEVNKISFSSKKGNVLSLSSLSLSGGFSKGEGVNVKADAHFDRVAKSKNSFDQFIEIVEKCKELFQRIKRTTIPYYMFVDEIEAYYSDRELFIRDLMLVRDLIFIIREINSYHKVNIIAAVRNEILYAMDRFIQTREINKIIEGFSVPLKWNYSNSTSEDHPIIRILMKRISVAANSEPQQFSRWFPETIRGKNTISYILDNGWNKPRDIVRLLLAAQNDTIHCNDRQFTQATFDGLRKEYSKNSLAEIRQELQSLYTPNEIDMVLMLLMGGKRIFTPKELYKRSVRGSNVRAFLDQRLEDVVKDFYRVGLWGNVNRTVNGDYKWRWNHRGDSEVILTDDWELAVHHAVCSELSIR